MPRNTCMTCSSPASSARPPRELPRAASRSASAPDMAALLLLSRSRRGRSRLDFWGGAFAPASCIGANKIGHMRTRRRTAVAGITASPCSSPPWRRGSGCCTLCGPSCPSCRRSSARIARRAAARGRPTRAPTGPSPVRARLGRAAEARGLLRAGAVPGEGSLHRRRAVRVPCLQPGARGGLRLGSLRARRGAQGAVGRPLNWRPGTLSRRLRSCRCMASTRRRAATRSTGCAW